MTEAAEPDLSGIVTMLLTAADEGATAGHPLPVELVISQILGALRFQIPPEGSDEFVAEFSSDLRQLVRDEAGHGPAVATIIERMLPPVSAAAAGPRLVSTDITGDEWSDRRAVLLRGGHCEDVFGDQTNHILSFGYASSEGIVGHHTVVAMSDHNIHALKDAFPAVSPEAFDEIMAQLADTSGLVLSDFDPTTAATDLWWHIELTEAIHGANNVVNEFTVETWHLLKYRLRECLPAPTSPESPQVRWPPEERKKVCDSFLRSASARELLSQRGAPRRAELREIISILVDFTCDDGHGTPLSWSPIAVEIFLVNEADHVGVARDLIDSVLPVFVDWSLKRAGVARQFRREAVLATRMW